VARRHRTHSNLAVRVSTAAVGIPLVLGVNYVGGNVFAAFVALAAAAAAWECARLIMPAGARPLYVVSIPAAVALATLPVSLSRPQAAWVGILVLCFVLVGAFYLLPRVYPTARATWFLTMMPPIYSGLLLGHLHLLRHGHRGARWVFLVLLVTWAYDSGAYLAGTFLGRRPFMQHVSSKKTVEGVVGGLVFSALAGLAGAPMIGLAVWQALLLGALAGVVAQLGDLIESMLKRQAGAKDSGSLVPGHGGLLDRIDGLLLTGALGYYASALLGYAA
jgi:phosphatidate cytidylyltransferase